MPLELFPDLNEEPSEPTMDLRSEGQIYTGDARIELQKLESATVQSCITSPPYWGLRDYGIGGQIGAEMDLQQYIAQLVEVFEGVWRVLRDDGTVWLNIGDSYTSGGRTWRDADKKNPARGMEYRAPTPVGLKPKDLIGVPWRVAFALQDAGWYLRSDLIWNKNNALPESVKDRPARVHEYVFLLTKSERLVLFIPRLKIPKLENAIVCFQVLQKAISQSRQICFRLPTSLAKFHELRDMEDFQLNVGVSLRLEGPGDIIDGNVMPRMIFGRSNTGLIDCSKHSTHCRLKAMFIQVVI